MKAPIILATDTSDLEVAKAWARLVAPHITGIKLGLEFFLNFGADGVRAVCADHELDLFLDLKLHDIPNTVGQAAAAVANLQPRFLTVHASGGKAMIAAAAHSAKGRRAARPGKRLVPVDEAGPHLVAKPPVKRRVIAQQPRSEAEAGRVGLPQGRGKIGHADDLEERAEDLLVGAHRDGGHINQPR